jgi:hypothetical protein
MQRSNSFVIHSLDDPRSFTVSESKAGVGSHSSPDDQDNKDKAKDEPKPGAQSARMIQNSRLSRSELNDKRTEVSRQNSVHDHFDCSLFTIQHHNYFIDDRSLMRKSFAFYWHFDSSRAHHTMIMTTMKIREIKKIITIMSI